MFISKTIELDSVYPFEVIKKKNLNDEDVLLLSGLIQESTLGIDKIEINEEGSSLNVLVYVTLANTKLIGRLFHELLA